MAAYQKFMFDNFVIRCEEEDCVVEPLNEEEAEDQTAVTAAETETEVSQPEVRETPARAEPAYTQEELDAALNQARQQGYENGFKAAGSESSQNEQALLEAVDQKLMILLSEVENYKKQLEQDSLSFTAGVIAKIFPTLREQQAARETERFLTENFPAFRKEAALSFAFNPDQAAAAAALIGRLADKNDFEGKIAIHKDPELAPGDCRVEWNGGGVERRADNLLAKVNNLIDDNPNQQEREHG